MNKNVLFISSNENHYDYHDKYAQFLSALDQTHTMCFKHMCFYEITLICCIFVRKTMLLWIIKSMNNVIL